MSILLSMALAAAQSPAAAPPAPAPAHAMHAQQTRPSEPGTRQGDGCSCCKKMAGGGKMECCAKHGEGHGGGHSGHSTHR